jgi:uncharacterized protein with PIN domain
LILFVDTSVLVKLYIAEPGSERMREAVAQEEPIAASTLAYAEIHVTKVLWPDFRRRHLFEAILDFQSRDRRYGGVDPSDKEMFVEADD